MYLLGDCNLMLRKSAVIIHAKIAFLRTEVFFHSLSVFKAHLAEVRSSVVLKPSSAEDKPQQQAFLKAPHKRVL